jgi:hypothetical protein
MAMSGDFIGSACQQDRTLHDITVQLPFNCAVSNLQLESEHLSEVLPKGSTHLALITGHQMLLDLLLDAQREV